MFHSFDLWCDDGFFYSVLSLQMQLHGLEQKPGEFTALSFVPTGIDGNPYYIQHLCAHDRKKHVITFF